MPGKTTTIRCCAPPGKRPADETDVDLGLRRPLAHPASLQDPSTTADAWRALLLPLCTATDLLARLDARAEAATAGIREGLIARLAYLEAAGFLAHAHTWAHPLDLALRERGLTASAALAARADKRSRLPEAIEALLRYPALTPTALAAELRIAPQTATALLRDLQGRKLVREVAGRGRFRAFAM